MGIFNQQNINNKISVFIENMNEVLEKTMNRSHIYMMTEKLNFIKMTQTQYHNLIFEQELFDILLKNKYAQNNEHRTENEEINYANTDYPFSLIICSREAHRASIMINNVGLVIVKFVLYLRMLNQNVARPDCPNCFLATNMKLLPFGRICIDVDFKMTSDAAIEGDEVNTDFDQIVEKCFRIVSALTTTGNIIMTRNCYTPNTRSFHLITEQQFDVTTRQLVFTRMAEQISSLDSRIKIDQVHVWMLPFGRGHIPVRKYNRKTNEFVNLEFPFSEVDFELCMPFDLTQGTDNIHTLYGLGNVNEENDELGTDVLYEYAQDNSVVHSYGIVGSADEAPENLQLFSKILSSKYDFAYSSQFRYRFEYNYLPRIFGNKYNNFFLLMSNKKLLFENNWQIPKLKPKQRPTEPYEIYRFISHRFLNGISNMEQLFDLLPTKYTTRNCNIGNVDELHLDESKNRILATKRKCVKKKFTDFLEDFNIDIVQPINHEIERDIRPADALHPWTYVEDGEAIVTHIASIDMKNVYEFYNKTLVNNTYTYEKCENVMLYFENIQSMLYDRLAHRLNGICKSILISDIQKVQNYLFPMYEFFCRVHYIDSCLTTTEYNSIRDMLMRQNTLLLALNDTDFDNYREKFVEMTPSAKVYRKFPLKNSILEHVWHDIEPLHKIILHIIYMMICEHNYSSIFFYLHNVFFAPNVTQIVCSFMLNIIDETPFDETEDDMVDEEMYDDGGQGMEAEDVDNRRPTKKYASREFLNFIYMTFINGGVNNECEFKNGNLYFTLSPAYITDMKLLFVTSPIWFFLGNFQYIDENMDFLTRLDLFIQIFKQSSANVGGSGDNQPYNDMELAPQPQSSYTRGGSSKDGGPAAKQARSTPSINQLNHERLFKQNNVPDLVQGDLMSLFCKYILGFYSTENGEYIYDGSHLTKSQLIHSNRVKPHTITDPIKYSSIYRHQYGFYNSWTMQFERHTSVLYTQINISNDEFAKYPELFNVYNENIYKILVNRFLKSILFTRLLNYQKNLGLMLAPIYDPNIESNIKIINYNIDSIQINIHDLASSEFVLPEDMLTDILMQRNKLHDIFRWLYAIICHYSESYSCVITTPSTFIPKCIVPDASTTNDTESMETDTYSSFQNQIVGGGAVIAGLDDSNKGERLIQRIHKILETKKREQRENITDELQQLSQRELTSLITLFDNVYKCDDDDDEGSGGGSSNGDVDDERDNISPIAQNRDEICKFNLSARGGTGSNANAMNFFGSDEYTETAKMKLLMNLFQRKLSSEIMQLSMDDFKKIIDDNYGHHIVKFVLLILSWFIRTLHTHLFTETLFFREIQQHRQLLYDELSALVFRHNGFFLYNDRITDISNVFSSYCRNVAIIVDPVFEMSFDIDKDLYLDYDATIETCVLPEIIKDIEDGCVSAIYQGQFIEDTNVDLNRLWARVTVPRNKHRISPLFSLHTSTGKSEYLTERCRRHFNNKYINNFLDASSLKVSDNNRGTDMAKELNTNLIVCVEEFSNLTEKFKQICGHSAITYKPLYSDIKQVFQNNATVILATNHDPKCTEEAVIARLHVYPRRIQYANVNKYMKFQRNNMCSTTTLLNVNNIMAVQMIMEKMPRVVAENYKGNYMMTWILKRFFLFNILDPITVQTSETLQNHNKSFHSMINAGEMVLERLDMNTTTTMTMFEFRKLVNRICEENKSLFNSKVDTYNVFTILSDKLNPWINKEEQIIHVAEKVAIS